MGVKLRLLRKGIDLIYLRTMELRGRNNRRGRKMNYVQVQNLYSSPNINRGYQIKEDEMGGACSMERREMHTEF
jgi:hypothetical protein